MNTHAKFDHTFGNQHFGPGPDLGVPFHGHHGPALWCARLPDAHAWIVGESADHAVDALTDGRSRPKA